MKRYLLILLYIACSAAAWSQVDPGYPPAPSSPQNVVAAEYFIDTDPGFGNATSIAITPGVNIINTAFTANISGLSNGVHRLIIRTKNNEGNWSIATIRDFLVDFDPFYQTAPTPQNIIAAEYFIDTDPGFGNGTSIAVNPGVDINNIAGAVNVTGLSNGGHRLYIRTKNAEGKWAITNIKEFIVDFDNSYPTPPPAPQNIVAAEYFINTDPGIGNGTPITITPATDINNLAVAINTTGLPAASTNQLYIRTKNAEGKWSISNISTFVVNIISDPIYQTPPAVPQNIIAAEYFINSDPGLGNGTPITITPATDISNLAVAINTTGLPPSSTNRLYIRSKNAEGNWSISNISTFVVTIVTDPIYQTPPAIPQNIIAAEYFINSDPGTGNGTSIPITPATDINNLAVAVNTTGLPASSTNQLYIRTKNAEGKWSITNISTFVVDIAGDPIYQTPPAAPQNIVNAEYFIDTDPGIGNGAPIAINPATDISNISFPINIAALAVGEHRFFLRSLSAEGKWSITNSRTFNIGTLTILPDSISFLNTIVNTSSTRSVIVRNNSASTQSITAVTTAAPFGSNFTTTRNIAPGATDTVLVSFTPTAAIQYQGVINLQTSAGAYSIPEKGTGISVLNSWVLEPATGHDYGTVAIGSANNFNFTIRNNGNTSITLTEVASSNPAFVPTYTVGTIIAAGASISLPVSFNPSAVLSYNAILKIKASAGGPDSVTTIINGIGFSPATPPTLSFVSTIPYDGQRGVNPAAGQTGNYTYKIVYRSSDNRPPAFNYPQVGIDRNGDQDFDDINEGLYPMTKEGTSTNYASGVVYTYTDNYFQYSNTMGYRFFAKDSLGNSATSINTAYYAGPIITYEVLDLKLFANDISFSKSNPLPGESFTLTANITNNSAFSATNVPVYFYRDTILIGSTVLPTANAFSTTSVSRILSFGADGFYPIKVWIDPGNTLNENNILNNYAIRPIIVGSPVLPGGITVAGSTTVQNCPSQKLIFAGHAAYFGTSIPTSVAGAEVTINTGSAILKTTTDANGNYNLVMENPPCGGTLTYTVSVTDFTFTSSIFTGAQAISCPAPNACMPTPNFTGGITVGISTTPCSSIVGGSTQATLTIKYRERNIANMWRAFDMIWKDTVKVYNDGILIHTYYTNDVPDFGSSGTFPGDVKVIPVNIPLGSTGPNNITVVATYVYNEFLQIPTSIYHGSFTSMTATAGSTIMAEPNKPDLTLGNFIQTSFRSFTFQDKNTECAAAGSHLVRIVDVTNPGSPVTVQTNTVSGVAGKSNVTLSANFPSLSPGVYQFRIITDTTELVDETDETNNAFLVTLTVPEPDLFISKITSSPTDLPQNASVSFNATIKNSGVAAGPFVVRFLANGVPIGGDIAVGGIAEKGQVTVTSNIFTVPTAETDCPISITVVVDAGSVINESNESNNAETIPLGADIAPLHLPGEFGSSSNPVRVRVNTSKQFNAYIRNTGSRDIHNVTVKFMHNGTKIGDALVPLIKAGIGFPAVASFTHTFTNPGNETVNILTDTANLVCEISEANNEGLYHISVTDSKEDFVVLSQYISPSSLNPNANQNITIVGTVKNIGNKVSPQSNMRFYVDNIPLGAAVPFNSLQINQDTTVAATVTYSSQIAGVKVIKITVDEDALVSEEDENNNEATRIIIVGDAPDMTRSIAQPISFNPNGFNAGDSVTIAYQLRNNGTNGGTAWVRFKVFDAAGSLTAIDSVAFTLAPGSNTTLTRRMHFVIDSGFVVTEIVNCTPLESNLLNNSDTLYFSTVAKMKTNLIVNNLDMKAGAPQQLPGWIGGKIVLGDYDLIVNGNIVNFDTAHFVVTNGIGKLKIINGNAQNLFPVGATLYRTNFAKINNIGTTDNFSVRVVPYVLRNGASGDTIRSSNVNRTWMIDEDIAGGSNGTVEMFWNASDELPGFDRTASRTAHFISNWQLSTPGNALIDSNGIFSRAQAGYTSFSPFTVTSGTNVLIPLRFIEFTALPNGKDVLLKWITEAEQNTSHFDVEFSTDGTGFTAIGKVNSANSGGQHRYEFTHQSPLGSTLYYRIRQVDLDGRFTYSKVIRVNLTTATNITLSPNPARNFIQLHNVDRNELREIRIVGMDGKMIQMNGNNTQMPIDIQKLKNGYYVLQVIKKDGSIVSLSFVKQ